MFNVLRNAEQKGLYEEQEGLYVYCSSTWRTGRFVCLMCFDIKNRKVYMFNVLRHEEQEGLYV